MLLVILTRFGITSHPASFDFCQSLKQRLQSVGCDFGIPVRILRNAQLIQRAHKSSTQAPIESSSRNATTSAAFLVIASLGSDSDRQVTLSFWLVLSSLSSKIWLKDCQYKSVSMLNHMRPMRLTRRSASMRKIRLSSFGRCKSMSKYATIRQCPATP
jgi:hypothetical protein